MQRSNLDPVDEQTNRFYMYLASGLVPVPHDNPKMEEQVICSGAELVEEDESHRWYKKKQSKPVSDSPLTSILNEVSDCHLECDGVTRVISFLLSASQIQHRVVAGSIMNVRTNESIHPHFWIELPDGCIIDYRARMSLGDFDDIPNGVFRPEKWEQIAYTRKENVSFPEGDFGGRILAVINGLNTETMISRLNAIRDGDEPQSIEK